MFCECQEKQIVFYIKDNKTYFICSNCNKKIKPPDKVANTVTVIITHQVFLTEQQRLSLQKLDETLVVEGVSSPVWVDNGVWRNEMAQEVFCRYEIRNKKEVDENTIRIMKDGYLVTINPNMAQKLLNYTDGGIESLILTHRNLIENNINVLHCFQIEDMQVCEKSLA